MIINGEHITDDHYITISGLTDLDKQMDMDKVLQSKVDITNEKLDETNEKLDETNKNLDELNETSFNIFDLLNPGSKNFWGYKLLELLGDFFKWLILPSDDYLSNWFSDVSDFFEDAFGILYYPVDLVIQVLGKFSDISGQEPVISFGNFSLFGAVFIPAYSYNFNDVLSNDTLNTIHNFYLITIDVILWLGLLVYCKNVLANIFGGKFTDDVVVDVNESVSDHKEKKEKERKSNYIGFRK